MKILWQKMGVIAFWLAWPGLWFYLRNSTRTRVLIVCGDEMLLVRSWLGSGAWDVPGGGLHKNEDPFVGAIREVQEETGVLLEAVQLSELGRGVISKHGLHYAYNSFLVTLDAKPATKPQAVEIESLKWSNVATTPARTLSADVQLVLSQWKQRR